MAISTISIIVPVYKVEKYLRQCLDSVISQTFQDWEMILIDDGSPDNCGDICDEYALRDKRIRVIHQNNSGLSVARNVGIACSSGKYIFFLDSDDYIPNNSLSDLIEVAQSHNWPDYIKGNHLVLMPDGQVVTTRYARQREVYDGKELGSNEFLSKVLLPHPLVWNGLIKRKLFQDYKLAFIPEAWPREDLIFHLCLAKCKWGGICKQIDIYLQVCCSKFFIKLNFAQNYKESYLYFEGYYRLHGQHNRYRNRSHR